jgi:predicted  nucleic acid-binding Zn-ribbon protein
MSTVYAHHNPDEKAARHEAKSAMQKKQMEILDEDGQLRRLEKALEETQQGLADIKKKVEKFGVEMLALDHQRSLLDRRQADLEHQIAAKRARVRRLEHEAEQWREKAYRGGDDTESS